MAISKKQALSIVFTCADQYKRELLNHSLLLVCKPKTGKIYTMELIFNASNFQHLTGLKTKDFSISPSDFYDRCIDRRLTEHDILFSKDGTTPMKLQVLPMLLTRNLSANMVGDFAQRNPKLITDKLAGNIQGCMGFVRISSGRYVPNTILKGRTDDFAEKTDRIILIYRKCSCDMQYVEIVHVAKNINWDGIQLPDSYSYLQLPE